MTGGGRDHDADGEGSAAGAVSSQRLDKWLWFARLAKTRTQAAALVTGGKIRINRERVDKPATLLRTGDVVTATVHRTIRVLKVTGFLGRRGPPAEAVRIYEELTPASERTKSHAPRGGVPETGQAATASVHAERSAGAGRPTKRDRRRIERLKDTLP